MVKQLVRFLAYGALLGVMALMSSCGGSSGGSADFSTVTVTASAGAANVDGDVAENFRDIDTNGDGTNDTTVWDIPAADDVNVTVASTINTSSSGVASNVRVESVSVTFVPLPSSSGAASPPMTIPVANVGVTIAPNNSAIIPVRVVTTEMKIQNNVALVNSGDVYAYNVTIRFNVVENSTGRSETIQTALVVRMANFAD